MSVVEQVTRDQKVTGLNPGSPGEEVCCVLKCPWARHWTPDVHLAPCVAPPVTPATPWKRGDKKAVTSPRPSHAVDNEMRTYCLQTKNLKCCSNLLSYIPLLIKVKSTCTTVFRCAAFNSSGGYFVFLQTAVLLCVFLKKLVELLITLFTHPWVSAEVGYPWVIPVYRIYSMHVL